MNNLAHNPYRAGNPVGGTDAFFGREDILREVKQILDNPNENALLVHGQRRIGKTSVLKELEYRLSSENKFQTILLSLHGEQESSIDQILQKLTDRLTRTCKLDAFQLDLTNAQHSFETDFIPWLLNQLPDHISLVLLFDEFDAIDKDGPKAFYSHLVDLIADYPRLKFVFVIGRDSEDLSSNIRFIFRKIPPPIRVSLLSRQHTASLVRFSEKNGSLDWTDAAIERIFQITHGHPYLTQSLCWRIWHDAHQDDSGEILPVQLGDVNDAIPKALDGAEHALQWIWDGLSPACQIVAAALAEVPSDTIVKIELDRRLNDSGVRVILPNLVNAPQILRQWDLIEEVNDGYVFRVPLFKQWISEKKPLKRVQRDNIDEIDLAAQGEYNLALASWKIYSESGKSNDIKSALNHLMRAIHHNPNHIAARQLLAEIYLEQQQHEEAYEHSKQFYDSNPSAARAYFIRALLLKVQNTDDESELWKLYSDILKLSPGQRDAIHGLRTIGTNRVNQLEQQHKYKEAIEEIDNLLQQLPEQYTLSSELIERIRRKANLSDWYQLALGAIEEEDPNKAMELLVRIINEEPTYLEATRYLHEIIHTGNQQNSGQPLTVSTNSLIDTYRQAIGAIKNRDYADATKLLVNIINQQPQYRDSTAHLHQSVQYLKFQAGQSTKVNTVKVLSIWDYRSDLKLLGWIFLTPQHLRKYREVHGELMTARIGSWLTSCFTWLPFFLPILALGISKASPSAAQQFPTLSQYLMIILVSAGLPAGWFGTYENPTLFKFTSVISFIVSASLLLVLLTIGAFTDELMIGFLIMIAVAIVNIIPLNSKSVNAEKSVAAALSLGTTIGAFSVVGFFYGISVIPSDSSSAITDSIIGILLGTSTGVLGSLLLSFHSPYLGNLIQGGQASFLARVFSVVWIVSVLSIVLYSFIL